MALQKKHKDVALVVGGGIVLGGLLLWLLERKANAAGPASPPTPPPPPAPAPSTTPQGTVTVGPITYNQPSGGGSTNPVTDSTTTEPTHLDNGAVTSDTGGDMGDAPPPATG